MGRTVGDKPRRALHWLTGVAALLTAAALLLENLDGYHNHFGGDYRAELPNINWTHGWPFTCFVRMSPAGLTQTDLDRGFRTYPAGQPRFYTSRWPFDGTPIYIVYRAWLVLDVALAVLLLLGICWATQTWATWLRIPNQFGLKTAFILLTLSAAATSAAIPLSYLPSARFILHYAALTIIAFALAATLARLLLWAVRMCSLSALRLRASA